MASRTITSPSPSSPSVGDEVWGVLVTILKPLASLRLTVALFALGIVVILFGTLAQDKKEMWQVVDQYFRSWFVWVELADLFPSAWFPNARFAVFDLPIFGRTPLGFPFVGGATIGLAMIFNLLAAHLVRFKLQSRGVRLFAGLAVTAFGALATFLVIQSGHNHNGLQGEPVIGGEELWLALKIGMGLGMLGLLAGLGYTLVVEKHRFHAPMWILAAGVVLGIAASIWVFGPGADMGQDSSSMRILWQLLKAQAAAIVLMIGCWLAFKQRGGIVLIHAGVGLMMLGELFVGTYAVEEQMAMFEGESVNFASDIRAVELAIIDSSPESHDNVVAIPTERNSSLSQFVEQGLEDQKPIEHPDLPFAIEFTRYYKNADIRGAKDGDENPATKGIGLSAIALPLKPGASADGDSAVDKPAAYFTLYEKSAGGKRGSAIGTYLAGVFLREDTIEVGGKKYTLSLRYKRTYKPYTMRLIDVRKDDYLGTDTPRNYSSDVHLVDASRNEDRDLHIWMNNPVRYAGETFYQSSYNRDPSGVEGTVLQVVGNTGWMIPYTACMMVLTGMAVHFSAILLRFLNRREVEVFGSGELSTEDATPPVRMQHRPAKPVASAPATPLIARVKPASAIDIIVPSVVVLLFAMMVVGASWPRGVKEKQPDLAAFGKLPVAYEGRVKPFDTVARTTLRAISGKETFTDSSDKRQPAALWLLDVLANRPEANQHEVFRIEHFDVLSLFGLKRREGYRYSIAELTPKIEDFEKQVRLAGQASQNNPEGMSLYQKKVLELDRKLRLYLALSKSHQLADSSKDGVQPLDRLNRLNELMSLGQELKMTQAPLSAPFPPGDQGWESLTGAAAREWIVELAKEKKAKSSQELAETLLGELETPLLETQMLTDIKAILAQQNPDLTGKALDAKARDMLDAMPQDIRTNLDRASREKVREGLAMATNQFQAMFDETLVGASLEEPVRPHAAALIGILESYRDGNVEDFNEQVADYNLLLEKESPPDYDRGKSNFEAFFNRVNPFLQCEIMYLAAFVLACLAWLFWRRPLNWASLALIVFALAVHTAALIGRIYIYGRPPVTNLYSSAIFIGWGAVVLGVILEAFFFIGVGNIVAAIAGFSTLLIAPSLAADGDTFTVMQAVLDTNFWLATHVVTITLGYATTFVAGILGVLFVAGGVFTPRLTAEHKRTLYRMTYGVVCFAMLFSFVGTVLGGLWADDSWGRFWGWDPKENGALIIVLWNAIVLHARWGGLVKERGLAILAIGGNIVTAWSWFGVNELGVGLHSYGFTEGRLVTLAAFMAANLALICFGLIPKAMWWSNRAAA